MSYFGTSGPSSRVAHSIAAGYQRRSNQIAARKTAPYLGNIGGVADNALGQLNNRYGKSLGYGILVPRIKEYGDPQRLVDEANKFEQFYEREYEINKQKLDASTKARKIAVQNNITVSELHAEIATELEKDPTEINATVIANNTTEAKSIYPNYNFVQWPAIEADLKKTEDGAIAQEAADQANFEASVKKMNSEMVKGMEDWFVDGGLVKESHARGYTTGGVIVGAVGLWLLYRWLYSPPLTTRGGNKSAAMAVFK